VLAGRPGRAGVPRRARGGVGRRRGLSA
jgi:hypothetical protein